MIGLTERLEKLEELGEFVRQPCLCVIPIPQSRERSESWTPMVRSESDLKSENLALSVFEALRDSPSSAKKNGGLLGMTRKPGLSHRLDEPK